MTSRRFETAHDSSFEPDSEVSGATRRASVVIGNRAQGDLPAQLRGSMEDLSGVDLSQVRVHRGSSRPAEIGALAYTQGSEIHLGPGQEKHLAHEAWHVVQQAQGRVRPTIHEHGVSINDDAVLEREADVMGRRAEGA